MCFEICSSDDQKEDGQTFNIRHWVFFVCHVETMFRPCSLDLRCEITQPASSGLSTVSWCYFVQFRGSYFGEVKKDDPRNHTKQHEIAISRDYFKALFGDIFGTRSNHNLEHPRLDHKLHLPIVRPELLWTEREFHSLFLTGFECYTLKAFQFFYRSCEAGCHVSNVQLNYFVTCSRADVFHLNSHR